jgi:hypothetical protein
MKFQSFIRGFSQIAASDCVKLYFSLKNYEYKRVKFVQESDFRFKIEIFVKIGKNAT